MSLSTYGFDSYWLDLYERSGISGHPARVTGVDRGECDVATADGPRRVRSARHSVCTGDWVVVDDSAIVAVLPRRTAVVRADAGTTSDSQTLAANVDVVVISVAADTELDLGRVERYVALGWDSGATPLVVLTKCDRAFDVEDRILRLQSAAPGVEVIGISARTGHGMEHLTSILSGTIVLIGPSGSGKSTLANTLLGRSTLATGNVREQDSKGRHTTVRRELVPLPTDGDVVIDTPGLRSVGLLSSESGLQHTFSDIEELAASCRFNDCIHDTEPGCAVRDGIDPRRLDNYRRLQRENHWATTRHDARANQQRLSEAKQLAKSQRQLYKNRSR